MAVGDVLPRKNLPVEATPWGRDVENRAMQAEKDLVAVSQGVAASLSDTNAKAAGLQESLVRLRANAGLRESISEPLEFFTDPPSGPNLVATFTLEAPYPWVRGATIYSLTWEPHNIDAGAGGGAAFVYTYAQPLGQEPSRAGRLLVNSTVSEFGYDVRQMAVPVGSPGAVLSVWAQRLDPAAVFAFDLEWELLVKWF